MSVGFHSWRFPSISTPDINETSSKDITASLHRNVLSWGVWRGQEEKESVSLRTIAHHSAYSETADCGSCSGVSDLFRTASVPDVVGRSPATTFSSVTIAARKVLPSHFTSQDPAYPSTPTQHVKISPPKLPETFGGTPTSRMRVSNSQPDVCRQNSTIVTPNELRQAHSPADELAVRDRGKRKVRLVQRRLSYTEGDRKQDRGGSLANLLSQPSYRSCIHLELPVRFTRSVMFLDRSLSISLEELQGRRAGQPILYRSTLSIRLGVSTCSRSSTDNKPAKTNEAYGRSRATMLGHNKHIDRRSGLGHCRDPLSKQQGRKVEKIAPTHGANSKADDLDTQRHSNTLELLSFRGPSPSNTKAGRQKGNADEPAFLPRSNFKHRQHTSNIGPVDSRTWNKRAGRDKTEEQHEHPQKDNVDKTCSRLKAEFLEGTPKTLSLKAVRCKDIERCVRLSKGFRSPCERGCLTFIPTKAEHNITMLPTPPSYYGAVKGFSKEALELFRPDFISRSQGRVRRLEQRALRRRELQDSNPDLVQGLREDRFKQKRNCTTPDPLSDNLFKPRERSISGREMQLRSRRIYNKLPEVTKKKEEEKKRAVSQTNRLRAEVFKKRLLDQILQR